jgi:hypothetical protein
MKGVVGVWQHVQRCLKTQLSGQGGHHADIGQSIPLPLEEQYGHLHRGQMLASLGGRLPGGMKWKAKRDQADNARQRLTGLHVRRHASAERLASCQERYARQQPSGRCHGCADRRMSDGRPIWAARTSLHIGELVAERGDPTAAELKCHSLHEAVVHARSGSMSHDEECRQFVRRNQETGDRPDIRDDNGEALCLGHDLQTIPEDRTATTSHTSKVTVGVILRSAAGTGKFSRKPG